MEIAFSEKQRADLQHLIDGLSRVQKDHSQAEGERRRLKIQMDSQDQIACAQWEAAQQADLEVTVFLRTVVADNRQDPNQPWRLDMGRGVLTSDRESVNADDSGTN